MENLNADQKINAARTSWIGGPKNKLKILFFIEQKVDGIDKKGNSWTAYKGYAAIDRFKNAFKCVYFLDKTKDVAVTSKNDEVIKINDIKTDAHYKVNGYLIGTKKIANEKVYINYRLVISN